MKLIISMTSYPPRIHGVHKVISSLVNQQCNCEFMILLVLSIEEFPNKDGDLPDDLREVLLNPLVRVLWVEGNIKSHKKLMYALLEYPDNPILIVDDDIVRPQGWVQSFVQDHLKYPNDIIAGTFMYHFDDTMNFKRYSDVTGVSCGSMSSQCGIPMGFSRPANGAGGVLYPPGTFNTPEFFDLDRLMQISPNSDESWQWIFNLMEGKHIRSLSTFYDHSEGVIPGSQVVGLYRRNRYDAIFRKLLNLYPKLSYIVKDLQFGQIIVSITSYGERLKSGFVERVLNTIYNQTLKPYKVVLTIHKSDEVNLTPKLKEFIKNNILELLVTDIDIGPHKKYYYVMQKYPYNPIVTIDDDIEYTSDMLESLATSYAKNPTKISARRVHKITHDKLGRINKYHDWKYEYRKEFVPSKYLFATGGAGVLYPPSILRLSPEMEDEILNWFTVDDIFLKYLELKLNVDIVWVPNEYLMGHPINNDLMRSTALYKINCTNKLNDNYLHYLGELLPPEYD